MLTIPLNKPDGGWGQGWDRGEWVSEHAVSSLPWPRGSLPLYVSQPHQVSLCCSYVYMCVC